MPLHHAPTMIIAPVKKYMMPYLEGVEEARYYVQEAMKEDERPHNNIGDELDAEQEKEIFECDEEDKEMMVVLKKIEPMILS